MDIVIHTLINTLIIGAIYTLISIGFNLIYRVSKFFNVTHGVMAVIGAYTVFFLYKQSGVNLYLSVFGGICTAGVLGMLSDRIVFLQLRKRNASTLIMFVASLGLFTVLQAVIALIFSSRFQILTGTFESQKTFRVFSGVVTDVHLAIMITVVMILAALTLMLNKTRIGKAIKAIGDDEEVAKIIGINTDRVISIVFLIGSAIAGIGGILVGFDIGIMPTIGMMLLLKAVTASIIGGVGNIYGGVLGAFLLGFVENLASWTISGEWKDAAAFVLLISFLLFRRRGILGS